MTEVIGVTTNDRTTVSLRAQDGSFVVALKYYAENRADFETRFPLTHEQELVVREFWTRVRGSE